MHVQRRRRDARERTPSRKGIVKDGPWDGRHAIQAGERLVIA